MGQVAIWQLCSFENKQWAGVAPVITLLYILLGVLLTFGTALFVASEFSLVALDETSVEKRAAAGDRRSKAVLKALRKISLQLSGAQVGITVTTILLGYTTQNALGELFNQWLGWAGLGQIFSATIGVVLAVILVNSYSMIFGELIPKNFALAAPLSIAGIVIPFQRLFTVLFYPIIWVLDTISNGIVKMFGIQTSESLSSARSAQELAALVANSAKEGALEQATATRFQRSVGIRELCAKDVMIDRGRMQVLNAENTAEDVINLARHTGFSRFPVVGQDADDVLGFVSLRSAVSVPFVRRSQVPVESNSLLVQPLRVPETVGLAPLLVQLRAEGLQIALVVDEYGGTAGIVTLEDVVEEIVGEVADEHDPRRRGIRALGPNYWLVDGTIRPDELYRATSLRIPDDGPYETVAGLMLSRLNRMAQKDDEIQVDGICLTVHRLDGLRIAQLRIKQLESPKQGEDDE